MRWTRKVKELHRWRVWYAWWPTEFLVVPGGDPTVVWLEFYEYSYACNLSGYWTARLRGSDRVYYLDVSSYLAD